jgi:hypothetical protein
MNQRWAQFLRLTVPFVARVREIRLNPLET